MARLAAGAPAVRVGTPLRVAFEAVGENLALPVFQPI